MLNAEIGQETSEIPASWFSVLNSLFIILQKTQSNIYSKIWQIFSMAHIAADSALNLLFPKFSFLKL